METAYIDKDAGLRELGFASPDEVELAVIEETGHISAVPFEKG
jgi:uncharacterized membrane protein YcaP (DUF421 family)